MIIEAPASAPPTARETSASAKARKKDIRDVDLFIITLFDITKSKASLSNALAENILPLK